MVLHYNASFFRTDRKLLFVSHHNEFRMKLQYLIAVYQIGFVNPKKSCSKTLQLFLQIIQFFIEFINISVLHINANYPSVADKIQHLTQFHTICYIPETKYIIFIRKTIVFFCLIQIFYYLLFHLV